jgi:type I restriction enzyme, R subunit
MTRSRSRQHVIWPRQSHWKSCSKPRYKAYHNRIIDAAALIQEMIKMRQQMSATGQRAEQLGLTEEELAFYDAVATSRGQVYDQPMLCRIIHAVVETLKRNLRVDWADPARQQVQAEIRAAVRSTLRKQEIQPEHLDVMTDHVIAQAIALYQAWPLAA